MLEGKLAGQRLEFGDPVGQVRSRIEPRRLSDPLQMHRRPQIVAPDPHQFAAARHDRSCITDRVAAALGEVFGLQICTDEDRRIVHVTAPVPSRSSVR